MGDYLKNIYSPFKLDGNRTNILFELELEIRKGKCLRQF